MLSISEIVFGVTSSLSIVCSLLSIAFIKNSERKRLESDARHTGNNNTSVATKNTDKNSTFVTGNQVLAFWALVVYHLSYLVTMYYDMLVQDTKVTVYTGSQTLGWLYLPIYLSFDIFVTCCLAWVIILVSFKHFSRWKWLNLF